jgi:hypothetical protein
MIAFRQVEPLVYARTFALRAPRNLSKSFPRAALVTRFSEFGFGHSGAV